jgi:hypothetical protein
MSEADFRNRLEQVGRELDHATTRWTATRRRRRRVLAVASAALIAVGSAVAISTEIGSHGTELAAAEVLERAARAESTRAKARGARYFYTQTRISTRTRAGAPGQEQTVTSTQTTEVWAGTDGSGIEVAHPQQVQAPPARETPAAGPTGTTGTAGAPAPAPVGAAPGRRGRPEVNRYGKGTIGRGELGVFDTSFRDSLLRRFGLDARRLVRLASSQAAFNERVRAGVERVASRLDPAAARPQAVDGQAFFLVAGLLGQWGEPMPNRLRGALFRFAGTLDGIAVDENFTDERGRSGIALSFGSARIVLAPEAYTLRATTYTMGNVETTIETVRTALVDRARERPGG